MTSHYIVWDANPIAFSSGIMKLPFAVNVYGLILAAVLFFTGYHFLEKREEERIKNEEPNKGLLRITWYTVLILLALSLGIGELIFTIIPSPMLHTIGPITVRYYGIMWAIAFTIGYFLGIKMFKDAGKPLEDLESLLTYVMIATVVGARLGQIFFYEPSYYFHHPAQIPMIWHGGLASHGAAIGIVIAIWLYMRKHPGYSFLWITDRVVIPVAIGGVFVRIGNFFNSEIIGHVTHVPWAIIFERRDMLPRHPSQLYEAVWYLSLFIILWIMYKRYKTKPPDGLIFGFFLVYMFVGRFMIEFTKLHQADFVSNRWPLDVGQLLSIPFILVGIWILWKKVDYKQHSDQQPPTTAQPAN